MRLLQFDAHEIFDIPFNSSLSKSVTLKRQQFLMTSIAIKHINDCLNDNDYIIFNLEKDDKVKVKIAKDNISVTF